MTKWKSNILLLMFLLSGFVAATAFADDSEDESGDETGDPIAVAETAVTTRYGEVTGQQYGSTFVYKGIPYAAAPVGPLRFAPAVPPVPQIKTLKADSYGSKCLQIPARSKDRKPVGSEDCLFLNIWKPANRDARNLPVMLFIHGGGNIFGSGNDTVYGVEIYKGEYLAENGPAVVVSMNYRLGALGFLAHPALSKASGYNGSGNYGLFDQIQALKWLHENIQAFGGDPKNITVFGQSAGGINILGLLASPVANGLFSKAIVESGFLTELSLKDAELAGSQVTKNLGCDRAKGYVACLRGKTGAEILAAADKDRATQMNPSALTIDGYSLPAPVLDVYRGNRAAHVPLLIGTNNDEMISLGAAIAGTDEIDTVEKYAAKVKENFGARSGAVLARYPVSDYEDDPRKTIEALLGDFAAHCPARRIARAYSAASDPVWKYVFSHVSDSVVVAPMGASHGMELPYVFHTLSRLVFTPWDFSLAHRMSQYWLNFAALGNPNLAKLPGWPRYKRDSYIDFGAQIEAGADYRKDKCDFWDNLGPNNQDPQVLKKSILRNLYNETGLASASNHTL